MNARQDTFSAALAHHAKGVAAALAVRETDSALQTWSWRKWRREVRFARLRSRRTGIHARSDLASSAITRPRLIRSMRPRRRWGGTSRADVPRSTDASCFVLTETINRDRLSVVEDKAQATAD